MLSKGEKFFFLRKQDWSLILYRMRKTTRYSNRLIRRLPEQLVLVKDLYSYSDLGGEFVTQAEWQSLS